MSSTDNSREQSSGSMCVTPSEGYMSDLQTLVDKYAPIIYLHSDERYLPCSIDWINQNSTLADYKTSPPTIISPVTNMDLYNVSKKHDFKKEVEGDIVQYFERELYPGEQPLRNVPIYALVKKQDDKVYIIYTAIFAYNGEYSILGLANAGQHPGDIEQLVVELDSDAKKILRVFYGAHSTFVRKWVKAEDVPKEDGRIVAYMALHGHGMYDKEGTVFRMLGLTNDYVEKGIKWMPRVKVILTRDDPNFDPCEMGWTTFYGRFGGTTGEKGDKSGIVGMAEKLSVPDTDASKYHPPYIFSSKASNTLFSLKDFIALTIIYFIVFGVLTLTDRYMILGTSGKYEIKDHITTIVIFYFIIVLYKKLGSATIKRLDK